VLSGVLFKATTEGKIELLATDLETAIKAVTTPVHIDGEGAFVVEAKVILEVIRNLPSGEIIFELQDNNLIVRGAGIDDRQGYLLCSEGRVYEKSQWDLLGAPGRIP